MRHVSKETFGPVEAEAWIVSEGEAETYEQPLNSLQVTKATIDEQSKFQKLLDAACDTSQTTQHDSSFSLSSLKLLSFGKYSIKPSKTEPRCNTCYNLSISFIASPQQLQRAASEAQCVYCGLILASLTLFIQANPSNNIASTWNEDDTSIYAAVVNETLKDINISKQNNLQWGNFHLEFCTTDESLHRSLFPGAYVSTLSSNPAVFERIKGWLVDCDRDHVQCRRPQATWQPFRLIHINGGRMRLVDAPQGVQYLTLSYCWGNGLPLKTTSQNLAQHKASILLHSFPQTLRDCIIVAQRLGIEYVWIDAICIIQDSAQDWEVQASRMADIYSNAYLNISATASSDCDTGIFARRQRTIQSIAPDYISAPQKLGDLHVGFVKASLGRRKPTVTLMVREPLYHVPYSANLEQSSFEHTPLLRRAWTMQERLLSRRTVHFGKSELVWECNHGARCECKKLDSFGSEADVNNAGPNYRTAFAAITKPNAQRDPHEQLKTWIRIIEMYSSRLLTFDKDRLQALAGLARASQAMRGTTVTYIAGLWSADLVQYLAWFSLEWDAHRSSVYKAPSWAWSSIEGPVMYANASYIQNKLSKSRRFSVTRGLEQGIPLNNTRARVVDFQLTPAGVDEYGNLKDASVVLSAPVVQATLLRNPGGSGGSRWTVDIPWILEQQGGLKLGFDPDVTSEFDSRAVSPRNCVTLLLGEANGLDRGEVIYKALVLERTSNASVTSYRRIGTVMGNVHDYPSFWYDIGNERGMRESDWFSKFRQDLNAWFGVQDSQIRII